MRNSVI